MPGLHLEFRDLARDMWTGDPSTLQLSQLDVPAFRLGGRLCRPPAGTAQVLAHRQEMTAEQRFYVVNLRPFPVLFDNLHKMTSYRP